MFRLIKGDRVELLTLARSARTSTDMIDRFYAKHLTAEMNVANLQSQREEHQPKPAAKPRKTAKKPVFAEAAKKS